jgi:hypothetical protein
MVGSAVSCSVAIDGCMYCIPKLSFLVVAMDPFRMVCRLSGCHRDGRLTRMGMTADRPRLSANCWHSASSQSSEEMGAVTTVARNEMAPMGEEAAAAAAAAIAEGGGGNDKTRKTIEGKLKALHSGDHSGLATSSHAATVRRNHDARRVPPRPCIPSHPIPSSNPSIHRSQTNSSLFNSLFDSVRIASRE